MPYPPVKVGIIGCGTISGEYLKYMPRFPILDVVACADLVPERAGERAQKFNIANAYTVDELLADPEIELVVNLTIPAAHFDVGQAVLSAGKHLYNEKPLSVSRDDARRLLVIAQQAGLRVGCAPDTVLGGMIQTGVEIVDAGQIGRSVGGTASFMSPGPESWHPDPAFLFQRGAGPLFDIGPYHLSSLIALLGPIRQVSGAARITYPERTIGSGPKKGQKFQVEAPTFTTALLEFAGGSIVTLALSFDVQAASVPPLELYGTEGTVSLAIPFFFGGKVRLRRSEKEEWQDIALTHAYAETDGRGIGVADMAHALRSGRPHRANGEVAYHVLDVMHAIEEAASTGSRVEITSTCERPAPMPSSLPDYTLDD